jgi:hypothetical protein
MVFATSDAEQLKTAQIALEARAASVHNRTVLKKLFVYDRVQYWDLAGG